MCTEDRVYNMAGNLRFDKFPVSGLPCINGVECKQRQRSEENSIPYPCGAELHRQKAEEPSSRIPGAGMDSSETFRIRVKIKAQQLAEARRPPGPGEGRRTPLPLLHHVTTFKPLASLSTLLPPISFYSFQPLIKLMLSLLRLSFPLPKPQLFPCLRR